MAFWYLIWWHQVISNSLHKSTLFKLWNIKILCQCWEIWLTVSWNVWQWWRWREGGGGRGKGGWMWRREKGGQNLKTQLGMSFKRILTSLSSTSPELRWPCEPLSVLRSLSHRKSLRHCISDFWTISLIFALAEKNGNKKTFVVTFEYWQIY